MGMPIELDIYDAFVAAGVKPEDARRVERKVEAAIQASHDTLRAELHDQLMTKADGLRLEVSLRGDIGSLRTEFANFRAEMRSAMLDQLKWTVGLMFTFSGVIIAAIKLL